MRKSKGGRSGRPSISERPDGLSVQELIHQLADVDENHIVVIQGTYGGYSPVQRVELVPLRLNVNAHAGFGPHDLPDAAESADTVAVVVLSFDQPRRC